MYIIAGILRPTHVFCYNYTHVGAVLFVLQNYKLEKDFIQTAKYLLR